MEKSMWCENNGREQITLAPKPMTKNVQEGRKSVSEKPTTAARDRPVMELVHMWVLPVYILPVSQLVQPE